MRSIDFTQETKIMKKFLIVSPKVQCKDLQDLDYGKVEYGEKYVGALVTYSCDHGYKLVGDSQRQCEHSGYWSGTKPECIKSKLDEIHRVHMKNLKHAKILPKSSM